MSYLITHCAAIVRYLFPAFISLIDIVNFHQNRDFLLFISETFIVNGYCPFSSVIQSSCNLRLSFVIAESLSPLFVDIEISLLLNRHFITLFTLFMTCRNRRLINLFVIFNRERLAIILFIKLITLLVNF